MWKLLTEIMGEKLYHHLEGNGLLKDEEKGCKKGSWEIKVRLLIDKAILKNCHWRLTNSSMAWIDHKKAYDRVLHSWILKWLEMIGAAKHIISTNNNSMMNWKRVTSSRGSVLRQVDIKRIFQGDPLSPLLFIHVVILLPLTLVLQKMRAGYRLAKVDCEQ